MRTDNAIREMSEEKKRIIDHECDIVRHHAEAKEYPISYFAFQTIICL